MREIAPRNRLRSWLLIGLTVSALSACHSTDTQPTSAPEVARFLLEADNAHGGMMVGLPFSGVQIRVLPKPVFTEYDIVHVSEAQVSLGRCLMFQLSTAAAHDLYRLTAQNLGRRLVLVVNGRPLGARVIDHALEGGVIYIFAEVPDAQLPALAAGLNRTTRALQQKGVPAA